MKRLTSIIRFGRKFGSSCLLLVSTFTLAITPGFAASTSFETIRATYTQAGNTVGVTLIVYNYTTSADLQVLSLAFQQGQDQGLATAISKTKAVGRCSMTGDLSIDVAFIQMVITPTGRQIIFIASRPLQSDEVGSSSDSQSFDLMVGEFDMNDTDNSRSTGFIYPASKLVVDEQGEFHYDLAGSPWSLDNVVDSSWVPAVAAREAPDAAGPPPGSSLP
ncbi:MAG: hypothetical protein WCF30_02465 [Terracidiphilus sp.]